MPSVATGRGWSVARVPLVGVLAVVVLLDLLVDRLAARLLHHELLTPPGWVRSAVDVAGLFVFHLASVLGVTVAGIGLWRMLTGPSLVPRGARGAVSALAVAFVPLAALGVWTRLWVAVALYLKASFTGLAVMQMLAGWLSRSSVRERLGLTLVTLPLVLHLAASIVLLRSSGDSAAARALIAAGEVTLAIAAAGALVCLAPGGTRWTMPAALGAITAGVAVAVVASDWDIGARIAAYGFGVELPLRTVGWAGYALALGLWVALVAALLREPGAMRLRGYGVALVGLSGYQLEQPGQLAATLVGLLCVLSSLELAEVGLPAETWRRLVTSVAGALGATEATVAGAPGREEARVRVRRDEEAVEVVLTRRAGEVAQLEVVCGVAPSTEPAPLALLRRGTERLGRSDGLEVATGDTAFDDLFRVTDARELRGADPVLSDELRPRMRALVEGWLGVWPGQGARYRVRRPSFVGALLVDDHAGSDRLRELVELVREVARS